MSIKVILYFILVAVLFIILWRIKRKRGCGPICRFPKKPVQPTKDRKEEKEEIKRRIKRQKGRSIKDLDLFKDFREKKK